MIVTQVALLVVGVVALFVFWARVRMAPLPRMPQPVRTPAPVAEGSSRVAPFTRPAMDVPMDATRR